MLTTAATFDAAFAARLTALVAETAADRRPARALVRQLRRLDAAGDAASAGLATALFESLHYRLPAFSDDDLPGFACRLYARTGRPDAAMLLAGLAVQLRPTDSDLRATQAALIERFRDGAGAAPPSEAIAAKAEAIAAGANAGPVLLLALEALDAAGDTATSVALFEAVWRRVRPMTEYWVYYRMAKTYAAMGRDDAADLLASLAIQIEPHSRASDLPYRLLLRSFTRAGRLRDAAELCVRRRALCPEPPLLSEAEFAQLLEQAGPLALPPPSPGRTDHPLLEREIREPRPWPAYGGWVPVGLEELLRPMAREPIVVAELRDAEVLLEGGAAAVYGADGLSQYDLSVRTFPALVRRKLDELAQAGHLVEEIELDAAVLISDYHFGPNLCHFLFDHATRLDLYRRAGVDIGEATVIGPELGTEYQRVVAERFGVRAYLSVTRRARVRVGRMWVSSNCHDLRHPAHWGAQWAVDSVRRLFDLAPRRPARRLLISRADSRVRRIRNHDQLAELLAPLGFEVIVPGRLPFLAQVEAFRDATHIIAPHGAGLANIVFCAPRTQVLEVFHPHYGTWAYAMLNAALDLNYASMVGRDADSDAPEFNDTSLPREQKVGHAGRDIRVDVDELERWLDESGAW
jgi:capsular polysaccharide biosynthesis protein